MVNPGILLMWPLNRPVPQLHNEIILIIFLDLYGLNSPGRQQFLLFLMSIYSFPRNVEQTPNCLNLVSTEATSPGTVFMSGKSHWEEGIKQSKYIGGISQKINPIKRQNEEDCFASWRLHAEIYVYSCHLTLHSHSMKKWIMWHTITLLLGMKGEKVHVYCTARLGSGSSSDRYMLHPRVT